MFLLSSTSAKLAICDLYELSPPPQLISYFITSTILPITSCSQAHSEPVVLRTRHLRIAHPSARRTVPQHALRSRQMPSKTQDARFSASLLPSRQMRSRTAECAIFLNRLRSTCGAELADTDTQKEYDTNCGEHRLFSAPSQRERRMRDFTTRLAKPPEAQPSRGACDFSTTACGARSAELADGMQKRIRYKLRSMRSIGPAKAKATHNPTIHFSSPLPFLCFSPPFCPPSPYFCGG